LSFVGRACGGFDDVDGPRNFPPRPQFHQPRSNLNVRTPDSVFAQTTTVHGARSVSSFKRNERVPRCPPRVAGYAPTPAKKFFFLIFRVREIRAVSGNDGRLFIAFRLSPRFFSSALGFFRRARPPAFFLSARWTIGGARGPVFCRRDKTGAVEKRRARSRVCLRKKIFPAVVGPGRLMALGSTPRQAQAGKKVFFRRYSGFVEKRVLKKPRTARCLCDEVLI